MWGIYPYLMDEWHRQGQKISQMDDMVRQALVHPWGGQGATAAIRDTRPHRDRTGLGCKGA